MLISDCKMCGGRLPITDETVVICEFCGTRQTIPTADDEKKMALFNRANRLRLACEFDKAAGIYESIVADFPTEAEAYWGLVLCHYGIEYVDDPATGRKIPTCHRSSFKSVFDDGDFDQVLENADVVARKVYREEAKTIEEIRKGILEVASKEEPYDIFICYKEEDEKGNRTIDSVLAQDIYTMLTEKDYRVFFSRISLEDKIGQEYEPYIFAALNSAKIMLVIGTDYEYFNAVWVKNEWSRFLSLIAQGQKKTLIPCYKDVDVYDIPKEFVKLQAQDLGKVGAIQDLLRGIEKILGDDRVSSSGENAGFIQKQLETQVLSKADNTVKLGIMALNSGDIQKAVTYFEEALKINDDHVGAYLGLVRALPSKKRQIFWKHIEMFSLEEITEYLNKIPDMLLNDPVSLLDKAICGKQSLDIIKAILAAGVNTDNNCILLHAIISGNVNTYELLKLLLDYGFDPNIEYDRKFESNTIEKCVPLRDAIWEKNDADIVKLLLDYSADVNYIISDNHNNSWSLLDMAVRKDNKDIVQNLLEHGADVNIDRMYGGGVYPILADAIKLDNEAIIQLLLAHGANPNYRAMLRCDYPGNRNKSCGIGDAILYSSNPVKIIKALLDLGANPHEICSPDFCEYKGITHYLCDIPVLDMAVEARLKDVIKLLIDAGASFNDYCILTDENSSNGYISPCYNIQLKYKTYKDTEIEKYIRQFGWEGSFWDNLWGQKTFTTTWYKWL